MFKWKIYFEKIFYFFLNFILLMSVVGKISPPPLFLISILLVNAVGNQTTPLPYLGELGLSPPPLFHLINIEPSGV